MKNKRRHKKRKKKIYVSPPLPSSAVSVERKKGCGLKLWQVLVSVGVILSVISGITFLKGCFHETFSTKEELWKERNYISGINIPIDVSSAYPYMYIKTGGVTQSFPISFLENGMPYTSSLMIAPGGCTPFNLKLLLKNNKIYAATTFKDIDGKYVGKMDFDHWEARDIQIANFYNHDSIMELMDNYQHVLFSMNYRYPNIIEIKGYFNTDSCLEVDNYTSVGFPKPMSKKQRYESDSMIARIVPLHRY